MSSKKTVYHAKEDSQFQKPFIDVDEWRERILPDGTKIPFRYMHGGFTDTNVKFSFCFPEEEKYQGRFFQFLSPFPGPEEELASIQKTGEDDKIAFAVTHGAYYVETNMGSEAVFSPTADATMIYRSSAAAAEYSRIKAKELYGEHRVYGYVHGGSGGGYKSMSCIENTDAWDGAVPYIIGSPMAIPNCHTTRVHGMRVLRHVLPQIADALEPGGSGDIYQGLNDEERECLEEVTRMGMPPRCWFWYQTMDDGALPVLAPGVAMADPGYFDDFWTRPGYLGADKTKSAVRDRLKFKTRIKNVLLPECISTAEKSLGGNGADDAFLKMLQNGGGYGLELEDAPKDDDLYLKGVNLIFVTGDAAGQRLQLGSLDGNKIGIGLSYGMENIGEVLAKVQPGDELLLDNSDYIAMQTYHRHQIPDESYTVWNQFRDAEGKPKYPQRQNVLSQAIAYSGAGSIQDGEIQGKVIVLASVMDESAFPWQADWYRRKVQEASGNDAEDKFRLWYVDHSLHDDQSFTVDELHVTSYLGALRQALLDLSDWVERGIEPNSTTNYKVENGQVILPDRASERGGIHPVVKLSSMGQDCVRVKIGEAVTFEAVIEIPENAGTVTGVEWSFEGEQDYPVKGRFRKNEDGGVALQTHTYEKSGVYFAVVRVKINRTGNTEDIFTQIKDICRMRVIVEE